MDFIWAAALKDLRRHRRDPISLLLWAGIPLLVALLLQLAFGGGSPQAHLLVADEDESFVSELLLGSLGRGELADLMMVEIVTTDDGERRIRDGDGSAFLRIPAGFGAAVIDDEPMTLELLTNPSQYILPAIVEGVLSTLVDAVFYLQRLFGPALRGIPRELPPGMTTMPDSLVVESSRTINQSMNRLAPYLFPPAITLEVVTPEEGEEGGDSSGRDFGLLFFPGMLYLGLLFIAQGLCEDFWRERSLGTLRRLMTTPRGLAAILSGKLVAAAVVLGGIMVIGIVVGRLVFGLALANVGLGVVWSTLFGIVMLLLLLAIQMHAGTERGGNLLATVLIFPLAMLGGSFFPFEVMPSWLVAIGRWTPNGWALEQFKAMLFDEIDYRRLLIAASALVGSGVVLFWIIVGRMRRSFLHA